MKKRNISLIAVLMALALLGVMAMQFYFLRQSYGLQSSLFDSSVNLALNNVVDKLSKEDATNFLIDKINNQNLSRKTQDHAKQNKLVLRLTETTTHYHKRKIIARLNGAGANLTRAQRIANLRDSLRHLLAERKREREVDEIRGQFNFQLKVEEYTDEFGNVSQNVIPQITSNIIDPKPYSKPKAKPRKYLDTAHFVYIDPQFGKQIISVPRLNPLWVQEQDYKKKQQQLKLVKKLLQDETADTPMRSIREKPNVIEKLAREYQRANEPLKQRINPYQLDSLLRNELRSQGINLPFSYDVSTQHSDSLIFSNARDTLGKKPIFLVNSTYQVPVFNSQVINDPGMLKVAFPQKNSLILSHMAATMATTAGLLFILIFCFGYTIYSILKQKKISEMKTDFINNMTHEFKTPVSTIMIASEALKDAEIAEDKNRVAKLANIIYEENVRLGSHIERVLNIARIEKDDFKLDIKPVDVNEMITTVLDSMLLKLQKHHVKIDTNLSYTGGPMMIRADELHFSNVIYNLVDNAIKYSKDIPEITITTHSKGGQAIIKVADKGIGMSSDQQSKIFEQFYRIPTGNLHDVKGFGLGLSYVNTIVKRLGGTISVKSERDKGSEFELRFDKISPGKSI
ncbi:sensor histidine kinase [Mucilaginibacter paludis]|uniref:histidine kinase n=1 Tax=Mucilaginibacter paludis DSM 18603 TaxID=714943 RepID=H1Y4P7_9SPHI|nr:HAMP domain-containing sensor histidine kinase [Mucilaginibacter paludis]EHQ28091.1 integral membrane sensor signal transduction histidine kinase [Mucilaginibacter paludis DSM 18603]